MKKRSASLWFATMPLGAALAVLLGTHVPSVAASSERRGELRVIKNCDSYDGTAGGHCTILSSNLPEIPAGARVFYDQAYGIPAPDGPAAPGMLDSNVVLYVGTGDWAVGRCTLNVDGSTGLCTFSDGVGPLAGFRARLNVSLAPEAGANDYNWLGPYSFRDRAGQ